MTKTLLAVDGNSIINRAFYGVRPLTTRDGRNTNAIYGFVNMIMKQKEAVNPDYAAVAFDLKAPTFRHESYSEYKAGRKHMPDELFEQLAPCKEIAALLGFHIIEKEGFEADDILGTLSRIGEEMGCECCLLTGDRDSFQLISESTRVLYAVKSDTIVYDLPKIKADYGVTPRQLIDVKALMGDASDNIPGVAGIGEKNALKLISECQTLDKLYESIDSLKLSKSVVEKLKNGKDSAYMSRFLAEIVKNVPIDSSEAALKYDGIKREELLKIFTDYELKSLIARFDLNKIQAESGSLFDGEPTVRKNVFDVGEINENPDISTLEEKSCCAIFSENRERLYIYCSEYYLLNSDDKRVKQFFENEKIAKLLYDSKEIRLYLLSRGIALKNLSFDIMLAGYVADSKGNEGAYHLLSSWGISVSEAADEATKCFAALFAMEKEEKKQRAALAENAQNSLYFDIELPLSGCLAEMEYYGFKADREKLTEFSAALSVRIGALEREIYDLAEEIFNINSPKQLGEVLFVKMKLPGAKKTKSGFSTDAETLEKLRSISPIVGKILEYRTYAKLKSTYADGLLKALDENNRLHTCFKQALTQTGRLSSTEPNLQNIPIRTAEGREIRKFFIPEDENHVLIDADYSQIELRILAAISGDKNMTEAFISGEDVHTTTAAKIFGVEASAVTLEMRKRAKAVNFGVVYGIGEFSLAADIGVSRAEAGEYIREYFAKYPKVASYLENTVKAAEENGYVTTLFGRRRYIPELKMSNKQVKAFGKRVAMNTPIQGSAADIIKIAMIRVRNALEREKLDARLILQVHDELIIEASKADCERAREILVKEMQSAADLSVPLDVSVGMGDSWYEAHE